jgi:hypothetical protein
LHHQRCCFCLHNAACIAASPEGIQTRPAPAPDNFPGDLMQSSFATQSLLLICSPPSRLLIG